ncbi:type IV secretory system conjugative DNA transfer family protein [Dyadobacter alkalitolerans]|uniref:type IV secretory system conjugative DNA transfer family protein n=1 Tax=Dyadobacter alkalitolerans TaxID=492736 RepID=UPI0004073DF5|nr:TraM recognition domain-containing protein [Dyadobacter alkalitolerans]
MESVKEKEFGASINYLNLSVNVLLSVVLVLVEGVPRGAIDMPIIGEKLYYTILKYPSFLERKFLCSLIFISLIFLAMQTPAKPNVKATRKIGDVYLLIGLLTYLAIVFLDMPGKNLHLYTLIILLLAMCVCMINGGVNFNSIVYVPVKDIFNNYNEQFPQNEKLIENELSVTYYHQYQYKNHWRVGVVPVVAPDRSVLILGSQGSGKTYTLFNPAIYQQIEKGFSLNVYDYAYPDLSLVTFNGMISALKSNKYTWGKTSENEPVIPDFNCLTFEDLRRSNRCNPFQERYMPTIDDCNTMVKTLLFNLNKSWINKEGDFWAVSAVNLLTSYLWFLRIIERNNPDHPVLSKVCTLPHAIQLLTVDINEVINAISNEPELDAYSNMFVQGLKNQAGSQIAGQIASTQSSLAPLSSPNVTWVMTESDMELEINNPDSPRIITMGNYTLKDAVYGAAISVYNSVIMKRSYRYRQRKFAFFLDELPTIFVMGLDNYIATIRKHKGCVWMGIQDMEQLVKSYGQHSANIIVNTAGTVMVGLVNGSTAERVSKMFGKTEQENYSASFNKDTSVSFNTQAKELLPAAKISSLTQGQFVGKIADRYESPIDLKLFSGQMLVPSVEPVAKELPLRYNITEHDMEKLVIDHAVKVRNDIKVIKDYCVETYA